MANTKIDTYLMVGICLERLPYGKRRKGALTSDEFVPINPVQSDRYNPVVLSRAEVRKRQKNKDTIDGFVDRFNLVWELKGRNVGDPRYLRRRLDAEGTPRYQFKAEIEPVWGNEPCVYIGKVIAKRTGEVDPSELLRIIQEVKEDIPEAHAFMCHVLRERDLGYW